MQQQQQKRKKTEMIWNRGAIEHIIELYGYKTYGYDRKGRLLKCTIPQFKCVSIDDIEDCVLLETEEQNKNIDIFRMLNINKLKKELKVLKNMNIKQHEETDNIVDE